jgi:hypothetical protein
MTHYCRLSLARVQQVRFSMALFSKFSNASRKCLQHWLLQGTWKAGRVFMSQNEGDDSVPINFEYSLALCDWRLVSFTDLFISYWKCPVSTILPLNFIQSRIAQFLWNLIGSGIIKRNNLFSIPTFCYFFRFFPTLPHFIASKKLTTFTVQQVYFSTPFNFFEREIWLRQLYATCVIDGVFIVHVKTYFECEI